MKKPFQDLQVVGVIEDRCYTVSGMSARIYLKLSQTPPLGWSYIFTTIWRKVQYPMKCEAGMEDGAIWVECPPAEFKQNHLAELERAVAETNQYFHAREQQRVEAARVRQSMDGGTRSRIADLGRTFSPPGDYEAGAEDDPGNRGIFAPVRNLMRKVKRLLQN
jgi:hypothetical protein